ncbi:MAG: coenzyme F420-0:L-glutamate ligase [Anaerolineae bacterium]|nr:coenzyme F420-0:L-glutamate ligase [Anaerolineae bacterium]
MAAGQVALFALPGLPLVQTGDDLAALVLDGLAAVGLSLVDGDVLVVTSKIVSKAEGRWLDLRDVVPSAEAEALAAQTGKDARLVEAILRESAEVSRYREGVLIVRHRLGFVSANAGIDRSNVGPNGGDLVLLLPEAPDESARRLCETLQARSGVALGVIISDTHGRPFRAGNVGVAIGVAGMPALVDCRGQVDLFGRELQSTIVAAADAIASAAGLLTGEAAEGLPVVLVRGLKLEDPAGSAADLIRDPKLDLYR